MKTKWYSYEFRLAAVERARTAPSIPKLARELGVNFSQIYRWLRIYEEEGPQALGQRGRVGRASRCPNVPPPTSEQARVSELERKVGQQALDLDFLARAFKRVKESRPNNGDAGATASTK